MKIDSAQINSVRKVELTVYKSLSLGTQRSIRCPYYLVLVLTTLILEKIQGRFVGTNETVRNIRVSVLKCYATRILLF